MVRLLPAAALATAATAGALIGLIHPGSATAQNALCSFGSEILCETQEVCTERAFNISLKSLTFGIGPCLARTTRRLYFKEAVVKKGGSQPPEKESSEDNEPGEDSDEGSEA